MLLLYKYCMFIIRRLCFKSFHFISAQQNQTDCRGSLRKIISNHKNSTGSEQQGNSDIRKRFELIYIYIYRRQKNEDTGLYGIGRGAVWVAHDVSETPSIVTTYGRLTMEAFGSWETSELLIPMTQCHIPGSLNAKKQCYETPCLTQIQAYQQNWENLCERTDKDHLLQPLLRHRSSV